MKPGTVGISLLLVVYRNALAHKQVNAYKVISDTIFKVKFIDQSRTQKNPAYLDRVFQ